MDCIGCAELYLLAFALFGGVWPFSLLVLLRAIVPAAVTSRRVLAIFAIVLSISSNFVLLVLFTLPGLDVADSHGLFYLGFIVSLTVSLSSPLIGDIPREIVQLLWLSTAFALAFFFLLHYRRMDRIVVVAAVIGAYVTDASISFGRGSLWDNMKVVLTDKPRHI